MFGIKNFDPAKWVRALTWIVVRRKLLLHVADAPDVRRVLRGPGAFLVLAAVAATACLSVTFCAQALGLQLIASGYSVSSTTSGGLADLAQETVRAAMSVKELHPNGWATALLLPMGVVLVSTTALAWLARLAGGRQTPRYEAWWLGMAGYLFLLVAITTVVGASYAALGWLVPGMHIAQLVNVVSFYLVVMLSLGLAAVQAWRRTHGLGQQNTTWELVAIVPILLVLLADLYILPKWAEQHHPSVHARSLSCDLATNTCSAALTLSNSGVLELTPEAHITLELASGANFSRRETVNLHVKWLDEPHLDGIPIQLQSDQLHYVRLHFEKAGTEDRCPEKSMLTSADVPFVMSAKLSIPGYILGSEGKSRAINPIEAELERPVLGTWSKAAAAACLAS